MNYKQQIIQLVLDEQQFVRMTLKGRRRGEDLEWRQVVVRPVQIKQAYHLQFSFFSNIQDISKNYKDREAHNKLVEILELAFSMITVQTTSETRVFQITKKGSILQQSHRVTVGATTLNLQHNNPRTWPVPADVPSSILATIGLMNEQGKVSAGMWHKFAQVNEFIKILAKLAPLSNKSSNPIKIVDCGCGSAYLTFTAYHYFNNLRHIPVILTGIDRNKDLVEKGNRHVEHLNLHGIDFQAERIIDYQPVISPDIVVSLHACDTATDESLALAIQQQAKAILSSPCCHHTLNRQLHTVAPFGPLIQHDTLKQCMADILTDTFRSLVLGIMGYKADVFKFVPSEHTDRNFIIRAVRKPNPGNSTL